MFGHVRGAFTDARFDRTGRFEMAHKGTIFLDEIGELEAGSQVKLLRVLQDRTYEVLGSSRSKTVDTRVVCATNKNLPEMVGSGTFREDLLYRINLITIHLPSLRERKGDIPLLVNFFIDNLKEIYNRPYLSVSAAAMKWLQQLELPGNIRQLKNLVERSILVSRNNELGIEDFKTQLEISPVKKQSVQLPGVGSITLEEMEIEMVKRAMNFHHNKITKAAASLGITRNALYRRLEKYQIPFNDDEEMKITLMKWRINRRLKLKTRFILFIIVIHLIFLVLCYLIFEKNKLFFIGSEAFVLVSLSISIGLYRQLIEPITYIKDGINAIKDRDFNVKFLADGQD